MLVAETQYSFSVEIGERNKLEAEKNGKQKKDNTT